MDNPAINNATTPENQGTSRKMLFCLLCLSLPLLSYYIWQVGLNLMFIGSRSLERTDFGLILCGWRSYFLTGQSPYQACAGSNPVSGFLYPPLSILFIGPLAALPTAVAYVIMSILSVTLLGIVIVVVRNLAGDRWPKDRLGRVGLPILIFSLAPVMETIALGHINIVILATFLTALFFARGHRVCIAGIIVAIGFWLKLYPATLGILFLSRQELRPAAFWSLGWAIALSVIGLIYVPLSLYKEYFTSFLPTMQMFTVPRHSQSIAAQIIYIKTDFGSDILTGNYDFITKSIPFSLSVLGNVILVLGLFVSFVRMRRGQSDSDQQLEALAILLLTLLLYSPVAWSHHFILAIPAVAIMLMRLKNGVSWVEKGLIAICWLALAVPGWTRFPKAFLNFPGGVIIAGLFYLRFTLSALCMMGLLVFKPSRILSEVPNRH